MDKKKFLFLCTGNSCRSQMAEGIMNKLGGNRFAASSAGSQPAGYVHPLAIKTMARMGIDISNNESKPMDRFLGEDWKFVITVCDNAREACPVFPGQPITAHWGFEDPAHFEGAPEEKERKFWQIALEIRRRIELFLALPDKKLSQLAYQKAVRDIGNQ
jgi:arsenate reductase